MKEEVFSISVFPVDSPDFVYRGDEMLFDLVLTNTSPAVIGFPKELIKDSDPVVKITDLVGPEERTVYMPRHIGEYEQLSKFEPLAPGESISVCYKLDVAELEQFHGPEQVNLRVDFMIRCNVQVGQESIDTRARATVDVVGRRHVPGKDTTAP